jgi:hypothetical protein
MSSTLGYSTLDNYDDSADRTNYIDQRRQSRNSTRKRRESFITNNKPIQNKLNPAILEQMHNMSNDDEDDGDAFNLLKTSSVGVEKAEKKEQEENSKKMQTSESMVNMNNDVMFRTLGRTPQPIHEGINNLDLNDYSNYGDEKKNEEYYKRVLAAYPQKKNGQINLTNKPYYSQVNYQLTDNEDSVLLQKMNYMITLLEDQQDERTNNVTEEVILYSFLGIFIIFIADTFVRAGKYVR